MFWSNAASATDRKTAWDLVARLFGSVPGWCTPRFVRLGPKSATPTNHARARTQTAKSIHRRRFSLRKLQHNAVLVSTYMCVHACAVRMRMLASSRECVRACVSSCVSA